MDFAAGMMVGCLVGVISAVLLLFVSTLTDEHPGRKSELSLRGFIYTALALLATGGFSYILKFDKNSGTLLLLLSVLVIARLGGFRYGIVASVIATLLLSFLFLPPIGSLWVIGSNDQLALTLFLLSTVVGSGLMRGKKSLPE